MDFFILIALTTLSQYLLGLTQKIRSVGKNKRGDFYEI